MGSHVEIFLDHFLKLVEVFDVLWATVEVYSVYRALSVACVVCT